MTCMLVRHKVADFDNWKRVLDCHATAQRKPGLTVEKVVRNLDDPTEVVPWFEVTDQEKARAFVNSPGVPNARHQYLIPHVRHKRN